MAWALVQSTTKGVVAKKMMMMMMRSNIQLQLQTPPMITTRTFSCLREADNDKRLVSFNEYHSTVVPFGRFTDEARKVVDRAQWEAKFLDHKFVGTELLLLGLIGDGKGTDEEIGIAPKVFKSMGISIDKARDQVELIIGRGSEYDPHNIHWGRGPVTREIPFTPRAQTVFVRALNEARRTRPRKYADIGSEHLLLALLGEDGCVVARVLRALGAYPNNIRTKVIRMADERAKVRRQYLSAGTYTPLLDEYGTWLTDLVDYEEYTQHVVGMQPQIKRVINILGRLTKNNPCLVGERGVGKTSVAQGVAHLIIVKAVISVDVGLLVRGDFEERLKKIMEEIKEDKLGNIVLFIDDIHMLTVTGAPEGSIGAINILKQALARGELQCIGATTPDKYRKYMENDPSLERLFQPVKVLEPTVDETIKILMGIRQRYEDHHDIKYTDEALVAAAELSHQCISDHFLPGKAITLIDEAASHVLEKQDVESLDYDDLLEELEYLNVNEDCRPIELVEEELESMRDLRSITTTKIFRNANPDQDLEKAGMLRDLEFERKVHIWTVEERIEEMKKAGHERFTVTKADIQETISSWDFHN